MWHRIIHFIIVCNLSLFQDLELVMHQSRNAYKFLEEKLEENNHSKDIHKDGGDNIKIVIEGTEQEDLE